MTSELHTNSTQIQENGYAHCVCFSCKSFCSTKKGSYATTKKMLQTALQEKENINPNVQEFKNPNPSKNRGNKVTVRNVALLLHRREITAHRIVENVLKYETPFKKLHQIVSKT